MHRNQLYCVLLTLLPLVKALPTDYWAELYDTKPSGLSITTYSDFNCKGTTKRQDAIYGAKLSFDMSKSFKVGGAMHDGQQLDFSTDTQGKGACGNNVYSSKWTTDCQNMPETADCAEMWYKGLPY